MFGGLMPPVIFEVTANVGHAITKFGAVRKELQLMEVQAAKTGASVSAMSKTMTVAVAATKALALATGAFIAYGVVEISQVQKAYNALGLAMSNAGVSTEENRHKFEHLSETFEKLGFDAANTANALSILVTGTQNAAQSQKLLAVAADLARAKSISLEEASSLLVRATQGNARVFKQFGISLDNTLPKAKAFEKAMAELEDRIGGRAVAYTKTFQGQLEVLGRQIQSFAESVGATVLPYLQKFVEIISKAGEYASKYKGVLNTLAVLITSVVVVAIGKMTIALMKNAAAWITANAAALGIVAVIIAAAAGFVYLWNKYKGFRDAVTATLTVLTKVFGGVISVLLLLGETGVMVFSLIMNAFFLFVRATANAQIKLGQLFGDKEMVKRGKATLDFIDEANKNVTAFGNKIVEARNKVDTAVASIVKSLQGLKDTKIDVSQFKLPKLEIADFGNWGTPSTPANEIAEDIKKALAKARLHIAEFNAKVKADFEQATASWAEVINRNFVGDIQDKLIRNLDDLIYQAQDAVNAYQAASNAYNASLERLTKTQEKYIAAVATGDEIAIAAAESAMNAAEDAASGILGSMNEMLGKIKQIQDAMIDKIVDLKKQIADLEKERTKVLEDAQKERLELEKSYNEDVAKIRKQYDLDVARAQADAAKRSAEIVKQSIDQLRGVFKSATYKSIADIYSGITYEGRYLKGGSVARILKNLGLQAGKAQTLANDAASLAAAGFSQTFIEEVISLGPDMGHSLAQTILTSTPESIAQIKAYWEQLQKVSTHGVDDLGKRLNSGLTLATEELTQQLADVQTELNTTLKGLESELNDSLTAAFNDYSKALDAINIKTAETIAQIDAQIAALMETIRTLMAALDLLSTIKSPGTIGTAPKIIVGATSAAASLALAIQAATEADATASEAAAAAAAADAALLELESKTNPDLDALLASLDKLNSEIATNANTGSVAAWRRGEEASMVITNNIYGNVNAQEAADAMAWGIRTSGDVQYRVPPLAQRGARVDRG